MLPGNVEHQLDERSPRQHAGRTNTRPSREYPGLASTRSPTYAHRQRRRAPVRYTPGGARSPGTSSTSSMGAVPGSTPDEPILVPPGKPSEPSNSQVSPFLHCVILSHHHYGAITMVM